MTQLSGQILQVKSNIYFPKKPRKDNFHLRIWNIHIQTYTFGLSNAPATFKICMLSIYSDMVKDSIEVFMDEFLVVAYYFEKCIDHLSKVFQHCEEINIVIIQERCYFKVKEGIVLGHKILGHGIQVDQVKVEVIVKLSPLSSCRV